MLFLQIITPYIIKHDIINISKRESELYTMKKIKNVIFANYKWLICLICIISFLALAEDVFNKDIMEGDIIGYKFISTYLISDKVTPLVKIITSFGGATFLILLTIILFITIKNKKIGYLIGINLISITVLNQLLKFILQRPRPTEYRIIDETGYSFPSGHSMISMAFYGFLIYIINKKVQSKKIKIILTCILSLLILMIGISRIYLGVHYTSDVLAGFLVSIAYLTLYIGIINKVTRDKLF